MSLTADVKIITVLCFYKWTKTRNYVFNRKMNWNGNVQTWIISLSHKAKYFQRGLENWQTKNKIKLWTTEKQLLNRNNIKGSSFQKQTSPAKALANIARKGPQEEPIPYIIKTKHKGIMAQNLLCRKTPCFLFTHYSQNASVHSTLLCLSSPNVWVYSHTGQVSNTSLVSYNTIQFWH